MFRTPSPPPSGATSPTSRHRILSFLSGGSSSATKSNRARGNSSSPTRPTSPLPVVSQLQLHPTTQGASLPVNGDGTSTAHGPDEVAPVMDNTASADSVSHPPHLGRKPSRTLARRFSASSGNGPIFLRRKSSSQGSQAGGISNRDLPPASSDFDSELLSNSEAGVASAIDAGHHTGGVPLATSPAPDTHGPDGVVAPTYASPTPTSPTKRARAVLFGTRSRKDSTGSTASNAADGSGLAISRPSSPTKDFRPTSPFKGMLSPSGPTSARRGIDKATIGLPTNFKHTGGGGTSSPSLETAIPLAGLESPTLGGRRQISAPASPRHRHDTGAATISHGHETDPNHAAESLRRSLAQINLALNPACQDEEADSSSRQVTDTSDSLSSWQPRDARLDTVREVPSGFIQRFEKAGQVPTAVPAGADMSAHGIGRNGTRADARLLFGGEQAKSEMEETQDPGLPATPSHMTPPFTALPSAVRSGLASTPPAARRPWPPRPSSPTKDGIKSHFIEVGLSNSDSRSIPDSPASGSAPSSRPGSPARRGRRKAVPHIGGDEIAVHSSSPVTTTANAGSAPTQRPEEATSTSPAQHRFGAPAAAQQDWAATLAEISEALNSPLSNSLDRGSSMSSPASQGIVEQGQRRTALLLGSKHAAAEQVARKWGEEKLDVRDV